MQKLLVAAAAALLVGSFTVTSASAKKMHRIHKAHSASHGMMRSLPTGNAAMSGNNGNSASGSNSLGHIKGGNSGGGM
jgi:hypothetical protein